MNWNNLIQTLLKLLLATILAAAFISSARKISAANPDLGPVPPSLTPSP